jgi:hypothetical protein
VKESTISREVLMGSKSNKTNPFLKERKKGCLSSINNK